LSQVACPRRVAGMSRLGRARIERKRAAGRAGCDAAGLVVAGPHVHTHWLKMTLLPRCAACCRWWWWMRSARSRSAALPAPLGSAGCS
jgi:hypothetical protein